MTPIQPPEWVHCPTPPAFQDGAEIEDKAIPPWSSLDDEDAAEMIRRIRQERTDQIMQTLEGTDGPEGDA